MIATLAATGLALAGFQTPADAVPGIAVHHVAGDRAAIHAQWTPHAMRSAARRSPA